MKYTSIKSPASLYDRFRHMPERSYLSCINLYERNREQINCLPLFQRLDIELDHILALFETGEYLRYLHLVDKQIENVIRHNIFKHRKKNILVELLFRKAASLFNLGHMSQSRELVSEILRIDPENKYAPALYMKCVYHERKKVNTLNAFFILMLISATMLTGLELLWIRPFKEQASTLTEVSRLSLYAIGILGIGLTELIFFISSKRRIQKHVKTSLEKHKKKSQSAKLT